MSDRDKSRESSCRPPHEITNVVAEYDVVLAINGTRGLLNSGGVVEQGFECDLPAIEPRSATCFWPLGDVRFVGNGVELHSYQHGPSKSRKSSDFAKRRPRRWVDRLRSVEGKRLVGHPGQRKVHVGELVWEKQLLHSGMIHGIIERTVRYAGAIVARFDGHKVQRR